jgi:hypothetical protein
MLNDITKAKLILVWLAVVAMMIGFMAVFAVTMTLSTGVMLVALCLVPPGIIFMLWPSVPPPTVAEVLHKGTR